MIWQSKKSTSPVFSVCPLPTVTRSRDDIPYMAVPALEEDTVLKQAYASRADLKAAEAQIRAARYSRTAIWQGGRIEGDIEQAEASLAQRQAELEDTRGRVESDIRGAFLDMRAAAEQVEVARRNIEIARQNLELTQQRLEAKVTENVEVIQAEQASATAQLDYIDSVFTHNVAKLSLARALGNAADQIPRLLKIAPI
jgi:outer membrane protein TolC